MVDKNNLVNMIQQIAQELGTKSVPRHEFRRRTGISERKIQQLFGSYNGLVEAAGLEPMIFPSADSPVYSDQELLEEVIRVLRLPEAKLTRIFFDQNARVSSSVCERRFGGWINTIKSASKMLVTDTDSYLLERIREYTILPLQSHSTIAKEVNSLGTSAINTTSDDLEFKSPKYAPSGSPNIYGDFINFRGLQHAPVNEQGVVFLFGMICRELGYVVEIIKQGFPDCEAKRQIRGKQGMWQRVRIEFEFQSRNFKTHGHDPDQCDLIVCWENDWPECPIEVLELKSTLRSLSSLITSDQGIN